MKINSAGFDVPGLGKGTRALYGELYGEDGTFYVDMLTGGPGEIAVISRLIAYLGTLAAKEAE